MEKNGLNLLPHAQTSLICVSSSTLLVPPKLFLSSCISHHHSAIHPLKRKKKKKKIIVKKNPPLSTTSRPPRDHSTTTSPPLHDHLATTSRPPRDHLSTPLSIEHYLASHRGAGVGLDVTPGRFVDPHELAELACEHPRVPGLWRAGQDYLMCGQVMAAASGIFTALRMRGPLDTLRFGVRALRLIVLPLYLPAEHDDEEKDV